MSPVPEWGCQVWGRGWRGGVAARCPPQPRGRGSLGAGGRLTSPGGWGRGRGPGGTPWTPAWCPPGAWAVTQSTPGQQADTVLLHYILYPLPRSLAWKYIQSRNFSCKSCFLFFIVNILNAIQLAWNFKYGSYKFPFHLSFQRISALLQCHCGNTGNKKFATNKFWLGNVQENVQNARMQYSRNTPTMSNLRSRENVEGFPFHDFIQSPSKQGKHVMKKCWIMSIWLWL